MAAMKPTSPLSYASSGVHTDIDTVSRQISSNVAIRIIIPTVRSGAAFASCLQAIPPALYPYPLSNVEIVVVNNGHSPHLPTLLDTMRSNVLHNIKLTMLTADAIQSAAYARNAGAKGFDDGIIIFLDDDVLCEPHALWFLIAPILEGRSDAAVGNYSSNIRNLQFPQKFKQLYIHYVYSHFHGHIAEFWTAIGAVRASVFHESNGFDIHHKGACGEDLDFGLRLTRSGHTIWMQHDARGQHLHRFTLAGIIRNDYRKGIIAVYESLMNNVPFTSNRHASPKARWAVATASSFILAIPILALHLWLGCVLLLLCATSWVLSRRDLLRLYYTSEGLFFAMQSALFMLALDALRAICIPVAFLRWRRTLWQRGKSPAIAHSSHTTVTA
jgi:glycosyltransferase involved in cell wall biosynthesis